MRRNILFDNNEAIIKIVPITSKSVTCVPWKMESINVVTGTKLINSSPFKDDRILTPKFQPSKAIRPGNIIINNKCGDTVVITSKDGTGVYPVKVVPIVTIIAVTVPSKQVSVEYLKVDQPLN